MAYCTKCGAPRAAGAAFCTVCGAALPPQEAAPQPTSALPPAPFVPVGTPLAPMPVAPMPVAPMPVAPPGGHGLRNFIIVAAVILLLVVGLGIAAAFYAVRAAKEKAESVIHQIAPATASNAPPSTSGPPPAPAPSSFPALQPGSSSVPATAGVAPLKEGMLVVTAIADFRG